MIDINSTTTSPKIFFEQASNLLIFRGESYPENSFAFYKQVFDWFNTHFLTLSQLTVEFNISYMNSSSTKCILDILDILNEAFLQGKNITVKWYYDSENNRSLDLAEEFKEDLELPFFLIPTSE